MSTEPILCTPLFILFSFFFLAQLADAREEIRGLKDAAARTRGEDDPPIERPAKVGNLQSAMHLMNDRKKYGRFTVSFPPPPPSRSVL